MPFPPFLAMFRDMKIMTIPVSFLLLGLQAMMDVKFSCPCKKGWNQVISLLTLLAPAIFGFASMLIMQHKIKSPSPQQQNNGGEPQQQNNGGESQLQKTSSWEDFIFSLIPFFVWICIFFIDGTLFRPGMFVCTGLHGGLPQFNEIWHTLLFNDSVYFVLKIFESNYVEHLRSYELVGDCGGNVFVRSPNELHDSIPLTAYRVKGQKILTTKRFISLLDQQ